MHNIFKNKYIKKGLVIVGALLLISVSVAGLYGLWQLTSTGSTVELTVTQDVVRMVPDDLLGHNLRSAVVNKVGSGIYDAAMNAIAPGIVRYPTSQYIWQRSSGPNDRNEWFPVNGAWLADLSVRGERLRLAPSRISASPRVYQHVSTSSLVPGSVYTFGFDYEARGLAANTASAKLSVGYSEYDFNSGSWFTGKTKFEDGSVLGGETSISIDTSQQGVQHISVNLQYNPDLARRPQVVRVIFAMNGASAGGELWVDNVTLVGQDGNNQIKDGSFQNAQFGPSWIYSFRLTSADLEQAVASVRRWGGDLLYTFTNFGSIPPRSCNYPLDPLDISSCDPTKITATDNFEEILESPLFDQTFERELDIVRYNKEKGLGIKYWEFGNEPEIWWTAFGSAYNVGIPSAHVQAVERWKLVGEMYSRFAGKAKKIDPSIQFVVPIAFNENWPDFVDGFFSGYHAQDPDDPATSVPMPAYWSPHPYLSRAWGTGATCLPSDVRNCAINILRNVGVGTHCDVSSFEVRVADGSVAMGADMETSNYAEAYYTCAEAKLRSKGITNPQFVPTEWGSAGGITQPWGTFVDEIYTADELGRYTKRTSVPFTNHFSLFADNNIVSELGTILSPYTTYYFYNRILEGAKNVLRTETSDESKIAIYAYSSGQATESTHLVIVNRDVSDTDSRVELNLPASLDGAEVLGYSVTCSGADCISKRRNYFVNNVLISDEAAPRIVETIPAENFGTYTSGFFLNVKGHSVMYLELIPVLPTPTPQPTTPPPPPVEPPDDIPTPTPTSPVEPPDDIPTPTPTLTPTPIPTLTPTPTPTSGAVTASGKLVGLASHNDSGRGSNGLIATGTFMADPNKAGGDLIDYAYYRFGWRTVANSSDEINRWLVGLEGIGKKGIISVMLRCEDNSSGQDLCVPDDAIGPGTNPIVVSYPLGGPPRLNYTNPLVKTKIEALITRLGNEFNNDSRVAMVIIDIGYHGEANPMPKTVALPEAQRVAEKAAYMQAWGGANAAVTTWVSFSNWMVDRYKVAFPDKPLEVVFSGFFDDLARESAGRAEHAIANRVGFHDTGLAAQFPMSGRTNQTCYADLPNTDYARFASRWLAIQENPTLPTSYEFSHWMPSSELTASPVAESAHVWWSLLNALDKRVNLVTAFHPNVNTLVDNSNRNTGNPGAPFSADPWSWDNKLAWGFFLKYVGKRAPEVGEAWLALRGTRTSGTVFCPDSGNYDYYLQQVNEVAAQVNSSWIGPVNDWRGAYGRHTSPNLPTIDLAVSDDFLYGDQLAATIDVTYLDKPSTGSAQWVVEYVGASGVVASSEPVALTGLNEWKTATVNIQGAKLTNSSILGNGDFRIRVTGNGEVYFHMIKVALSTSPGLFAAIREGYFHQGIDIKPLQANAGSNLVYTTHAGFVTYAGPAPVDLKEKGWLVQVESDVDRDNIPDFITRYTHLVPGKLFLNDVKNRRVDYSVEFFMSNFPPGMSKLPFGYGPYVARNQLIAIVGDSGSPGKRHIQYEIVTDAYTTINSGTLDEYSCQDNPYLEICSTDLGRPGFFFPVNRLKPQQVGAPFYVNGAFVTPSP